MTNTLTVHLGDLAESLAELRRRFRQAARAEVARAVGEALRELAQALICGPARYSASMSSHASGWDDDPWQDPRDNHRYDPWQNPITPPEEEDEPEDPPRSLARLQASLVVGLGAARWSFVQTRQIPAAVMVGLGVALVAYVGGPTIQAFFDAWTTANDLLSHPGPDRKR